MDCVFDVWLGREPPNVSNDAEDSLPRVLIQAGRRAWELHGEASGIRTLDKDVAVSLLARHLVELAKAGMTEEGALAAAGLRYLVSLTTQSPPSVSSHAEHANEGIRQPREFSIDSANAKFLLQWRIPWG